VPQSITRRFGGGRRDGSDPNDPTPRIAILGAGIGGLCMGIELSRAGIGSFTIFEKSNGVGGTWRDNTYPGATCDVPSHFYSFSFATSPEWSRIFPEQPEILRYLEDCADRFDLRPHLRLSTAIVDATFDDATLTWTLHTDSGEPIVADIVVSGLGQLNVPAYPDVPGRDDFTGTAFHSARWDHDHSLLGERVAVIGNAASAVQFVPRIAEGVAQLSVFQRSPNWIMEKPDVAYPEKAKRLFRRLPFLRRLHRAQIYLSFEAKWFVLRDGSRTARRLERKARAHLERQVPDVSLRAELTPDYPIGCKRMLMSNDYYPALLRDNVELVTAPIERITHDGITTADGTHRVFDTIIYATGFRTTEFLAPIEVTGHDGARLHETWRDGAEAYLGMTVTGFPNFFMLYGPNTNLGTNSIEFMIECQVGYILRCIEEMRARGVAAVDVRPDAMATYNREIQRRLAKTVWSAGCSNWYKTESGRITNNWPGPAAAYWWRTRRPDWDALSSRRRSDGAPTAGRAPAR